MAAFGIGIALGLLLLVAGFLLLLPLGAVSILSGEAGVAVALLSVPLAAVLAGWRRARQRRREDEGTARSIEALQHETARAIEARQHESGRVAEAERPAAEAAGDRSERRLIGTATLRCPVCRAARGGTRRRRWRESLEVLLLAERLGLVGALRREPRLVQRAEKGRRLAGQLHRAAHCKQDSQAPVLSLWLWRVRTEKALRDPEAPEHHGATRRGGA